MTLTKATEQQVEKLAAQSQESFLDNLTGAFFRRSDWWAFWIVSLVALAVYFYTLAPTVTLEDSGELAVASDYLGVPHPPGYPIWTLITWFFQWIFHWVKYNGHPNPAWSVGLASAVAGAGACGLLALLISRSGADLLRSVPTLTERIGFAVESGLCLVAGISGGLLLAFSPVLWSQSVIVEVYSLNALFQMAVLLLIYMWMCRPKNDVLLFVAAFLFGLGLTNHQTLLFLGLALGVAVLLKDVNLFRDFAVAAILIGIVFIFAAKGYSLFASEAEKNAPGYVANVWKWSAGPETTAFWVYNALFLTIPLALAFVLPNGKTVCVSILLAELGVAFYMYLPIASEQNPPMNWGYARTWEGFMHAVTRGQYEAIVPTDIFSEKFLQQLGAYLSDLREQFSLPVAVLGFLPFCAWGVRVGGRQRSVFPVALGLMLASTALIVLETVTGWLWVERLYRLLIAPILLLAGWGLLSLMVLIIKTVITNMRTSSTGTRLMTGGFLLALLLAGLYVAYMSLKAVVNSIGVEPQDPQFLSAAGRIFYVGLALGPPLAMALALALILSPLRLNFDLGASQQRWLLTSVVGFFSVSVIFLIFQNPSLDIQNLFIGRVQFIQSHALYALWLGYGILLTIAWLERWWGTGAMKAAALAGLLLPGILLWQNAYDEEQIKIVGGAEQNGHSYGWQFGNWGLEGIRGIKADFQYWFPREEDFAREWGALTNALGMTEPDYPPPMTTNAIFYGGTDPGRFVPTYMIYSANVRSDVYLITQNALADNTFMNITRDLYGDTIYIPSLEDSNEAFRRYVDDVNAGRIQAGADIKIEGGKVSVQGVGGVMTINGILAKLIFDENKERHDFYVEESYVIQWMYPYLTPNGIMLKLNRDRVANLDPKLVENDQNFWRWYTDWLLGQSKFRRDICARKSFSKLRSAIAGIYDYRRMYADAETAFKQSIALYPLSPEATFRLAQMYMNMQRFADAEKLVQEFAAQDPQNESAGSFLTQIQHTRQMLDRRQEIERHQREQGAISPAEAFELISIYRASGMQSAYIQTARRFISEPAVPMDFLYSIASLFAQDQRIDELILTLEQLSQRDPAQPSLWLDLGATYIFVQRESDAIAAARKAIELGGQPARDAILQDPRYQPLATNPQFRALFPRQAAQPTKIPWTGGQLPNLPGLR